jgi:alkanesulfonate monooxygenase SsuD/methylene tetrahydromethanopterin reductase-like flavin-dependent oxidoreductase (luciferase family)
MDSLWAIGHHFIGYQQVPSNFMMLTYSAARTKRIHARHRGQRVALA